MIEGIAKTGVQHVTEIQDVKMDLIEKALHMRCSSYISSVKAQLFTETIFENDHSKRILQEITQEIKKQRDLVTVQKTKIEQKNYRLKEIQEELEKRVKERTSELERSNEELLREIDRRKQAEEGIHYHSNFLENILESLTHPFYVIDINNHIIVKANSVANEMFNLQKDSLCYSIKHGRDTQCKFRGEKNHCPLEKVKKSKKPVTLEHIHYDKDNIALNFEVHGFPIFNSEGNVVQIIEYSIDITERKQAEERSRAQREQLVQADKMASLGVLVAGIAHEINNPNQFVISNAPLLREAWESVMPILEEYYKENGDFAVGGVNYSEIKAQIPLYVSRIVEGAKRVDQIVTGLRLFSRQGSEEMWDRVNVNLVVKSAITIVYNLIKMSTDNFVVSTEEDLPYIKGHFQRLEQVLMNLLQNSCQALPDRGKGIYVKTSYNKKKQIVEIEVKDEGIGIPHEDLSKIKNPFFTTKNGLRGIGLGLSIVSTIIEEHRGGLNFVSESGKGTTATITLPTTENSLLKEKANEKSSINT